MTPPSQSSAHHIIVGYRHLAVRTFLNADLRCFLTNPFLLNSASLASLFLPFTDSISLYVLAMITMMLSFASTVSAAIMIHTHRSRVDDTATEAVRYFPSPFFLDQSELPPFAHLQTAYLNAAEHAQYGLQPLSIILSIPSSLLSWSLLTSSLSIIIMILGHQDLPVKIALSCLWVIVAHFITTVVRFFKFSR